jgi:hypothetical protein
MCPAEVKYHGPSPQERIANRLKNSGEGANPDYTVKQGDSPNRTISNVHHSAGQKPARERETRR